ncbi:MAG: right-handed parallel beta-helix repeat-containing protein, partial [Myxococcota bacterium]|nr:right-handed parallel beta-helix repeat-containing protein [Myxococcota bacterium]
MWVFILSIAWSKPIQVGSEGYSLRRALDVAQPGDVIEIVENQSNVCAEVAKDIKIVGRESVRLQGKKRCKYMFTVTQGTFELTAVNLSNTDSGGVYAVGKTAKVLLDRVRFEGLGNKKAKTSALYLDGAEAALKDSVFLSNQGSYGSAIQLRKNAVARIQGTRFEDNASVVGGAIYATEGATLTLNSSEFVKNQVISGGMGGALSLRDDSSVSIQDSLFEENSSQGKGGAIYAQQSRRQGYLSLTVSNSRLLSNHAPVGAGTGGALYVRGQSRISIRDSVIQDNDASSHAGGIFLYDVGGTVDLQNTSFHGNRSRTGAGGAIYAASRNEAGAVELDIRGGSFTENESAVYGGALSIGMKENPFGSLLLDNVLFEQNTAGSSRTGVGGAVHAYFNQQGTLRIQKSRFLSNRAELTGGALYAYGLLRLDIQGSTFWNNAAQGPSNVLERFGGAVFVDASKQIRIRQNRFCRNVSLSKGKSAVEAHGGAIYLQKSDMFTLE